MDQTHSTSDRDEAQQILESLRQIQDDAVLRAEAETNPEAVMDRLGLAGVARHAVAFGIAGLLIAPVAVHPNFFWN